MSAHSGAPGLRRPQMATPIPAPALKRRAIVAAATMLCAPAFAGMALAAIGATGGSDQAGVGTLAGSRGLHGKATPVAPAPAAPVKRTDVKAKSPAASKAHSATGHKDPARSATRPAQPPAPPTHRAPSPPRSRSVPPPTYPADPSQPGAPTDTTSTAPTSGGSGATSTTSGSDGSSSGSGSGTSSYTYPGGG
jgi:hypothetical protein